jgi:putative ABC transport system permease protein
MFQDLRFGFQTRLKRRVFTAIAVLTLGLGIGANTAIFSIFNTVLLRPLRIAHRNRSWRSTAAFAGSYLSFPYADYKDYRDHNQSLAGLAAYSMMPVSLSEAVSRRGSDRRDEC